MSASGIPTQNFILPEERTQIADIQKDYNMLTRRYGELYFQNKFIAVEMQEIDTEMTKVESKRIELMVALQEKYGAGSIDINTGAFIPAPIISELSS